MSTRIEWTNETWNPVTGCDPISAGCQNCYAQRMSKRLAGRFGYPKKDPFKVTLHPRLLTRPHEWKRPRSVFVCSMGDLFHYDVIFTYIASMFQIMKNCNKHIFQILTKRPYRMIEFFQWAKLVALDIPCNVWLGVTAENQEAANERIPLLLKCPAPVQFVSCEPFLEPIVLNDIKYIDWVIVGAETGPGKRPMNLDWARSIRDQCQAAGVPFFFKKDSQGNRKLDGQYWEQIP